MSFQLDDGLGTRIFFFPEETYTLTELDFLPHGGVSVLYGDGGTDPGAPAGCFVNGTFIATANADVVIENLKVGDVLLTRDNGPQSISWIGKRKMAADTSKHLLPIRIKANTFGNDLPKHDLLDSPQHRILVSDWRAELMFDATEVLAAAKHLVNEKGTRIATTPYSRKGCQAKASTLAILRCSLCLKLAY